MIVGIHHVAVGVPDFEQGLRFYRDLLGFEVVQATGATILLIGLTGTGAWPC